jgi:ElaB/YqjD/DUF883 family membrane-anchored ribosome-binding protein
MPAAAGKAARTDNSSPDKGSTATGQDLEADVARLKADIAELTELLKRTGEHSYGAARRAAAGGAETLRAQGEATVESLRASANDVEAQLVQAVREKPLTALSIAAGIGYLFALLNRR